MGSKDNAVPEGGTARYNNSAMGPSYFDHNATTPLDPRVVAAMIPWLAEHHGNPSSSHSFGRAARSAVEEARAQIAAAIGGRSEEVLFTASGTEALNQVLLQTLPEGSSGAGDLRGDLVISAFEHPAVEVAAARMESVGHQVVRIHPGPDGVVPAEAMIAAIEDSAASERGLRLVALMMANNELGTLQPVAEVSAVCRRLGVPLLCDAVQATGKIAVDVGTLGIDYLVLGGHKLHGPLGAAALWVRPGAPIGGYLLGASQERGLRASTENVPAIVGLGLACELAHQELDSRIGHLLSLRDRLETALLGSPEAFGEVRIHGHQASRLPHTSNVAFLGTSNAALMARLDRAGFAVSTGAACNSGGPKPTRTLASMGLSPEEACSSLRISFGMTNTVEEIDRFLAVLPRELAALRKPVPVGGLRGGTELAMGPRSIESRGNP